VGPHVRLGHASREEDPVDNRSHMAIRGIVIGVTDQRKINNPV
jgi:hypothetical protein